MAEGASGAGYGALFLRACTWNWRHFEPSQRRLTSARESRRERLESAETAFNEAEGRLLEAAVRHGSGSQEHALARSEWERRGELLKRLERTVGQEDFRSAVRFLGIDVTREQVSALANTALLASFALSALVLVLLAYLRVPLESIRYLVAPLLIAPVALYSLVYSYPEVLAGRAKRATIGQMPEAINYMAISMRLNPSLNRALSFAARYTGEPFASSLKGALWGVYTRRYHSIEAAFLDFAREWGGWSEDFKRALYAIRGAALERTEEGLRRALDKASDVIVSGTKERFEEFASGLTGPTTVLFSLGVILPMIVGAMLPLMAISAPSSPTSFSMTQESGQAGGMEPIWIVLIMDVAFPAMTFVYAYHLLGKRPGGLGRRSARAATGRRHIYLGPVVAVSIALASLASHIYLPGLVGAGELCLLALSGLVAGLSTSLYLGSRDAYKEELRVLGMERELPDALFQLGSRVAEGAPVEVAMEEVSRGMGGTAMGDLLRRTAFSLKVRRGGLESALFGQSGTMRGVGSRTVLASMRAVVGSTEKGSVESGDTIIGISGYLRELAKLEHDMRVRLSSVVGMMRATSTVFAPLVLGITCTLYALLSTEFSALPDSTQMMPTYQFTSIMAVYLVLTVLITNYFTDGMSGAGSKASLMRNAALSLPVAFFLFLGTLGMSQVLML